MSCSLQRCIQLRTRNGTSRIRIILLWKHLRLGSHLSFKENWQFWKILCTKKNTFIYRAFYPFILFVEKGHRLSLPYKAFPDMFFFFFLSKATVDRKRMINGGHVEKAKGRFRVFCHWSEALRTWLCTGGFMYSDATVFSLGSRTKLPH